ncbi:MAG: trypsin-like serine protease [bacterium]|nr:trypsin-like serine protease [bacterium]
MAGTCDWPSAVLMSGCSGTLIHPEVVIFAAHCGNTNNVRFGVRGDERSVPTDYCRDAPQYPETGWDIAYCKLSRPVTDVPIAPILIGCEWDQLQVGTEVWFASFGQSSPSGGGFGTKRFVSGEIAGFPSDGKKIGIFYDDNDTGICSGDSGGANFVRINDSSWRAFGITVTTAGACGGSSQSVPMRTGVPWIEEDSGIDVTPCHDADGAWNPGPDCVGFPQDIDDGSGKSWSQGCGPGVVSSPSATCGPTAGEDPDTTAPTVTIDSPAAGTYDGPSFTTSIEITATDDWGLLDVVLSIDRMEVGVLTQEPYTFPRAAFPEGTFEITARGRDWSGNMADAAPVEIVVGSGTPDPSTGTSSDSGSASGSGTGDPTGGTSGGTTGAMTGDSGASDASGTTDTDGESGGGAGGGDGCSCRTAGGPVGVVPLLVFFGLRRRSRR